MLRSVKIKQFQPVSQLPQKDSPKRSILNYLFHVTCYVPIQTFTKICLSVINLVGSVINAGIQGINTLNRWIFLIDSEKKTTKQMRHGRKFIPITGKPENKPNQTPPLEPPKISSVTSSDESAENIGLAQKKSLIIDSTSPELKTEKTNVVDPTIASKEAFEEIKAEVHTEDQKTKDKMNPPHNNSNPPTFDSSAPLPIPIKIEKTTKKNSLDLSKNDSPNETLISPLPRPIPIDKETPSEPESKHTMNTKTPFIRKKNIIDRDLKKRRKGIAPQSPSDSPSYEKTKTKPNPGENFSDGISVNFNKNGSNILQNPNHFEKEIKHDSTLIDNQTPKNLILNRQTNPHLLKEIISSSNREKKKKPKTPPRLPATEPLYDSAYKNTKRFESKSPKQTPGSTPPSIGPSADWEFKCD